MKITSRWDPALHSSSHPRPLAVTERYSYMDCWDKEGSWKPFASHVRQRRNQTGSLLGGSYRTLHMDSVDSTNHCLVRRFKTSINDSVVITQSVHRQEERLSNYGRWNEHMIHSTGVVTWWGSWEGKWKCLRRWSRPSTRLQQRHQEQHTTVEMTSSSSSRKALVW